LAARRLWFIMLRAVKAPRRRHPVSSTLGGANKQSKPAEPSNKT
jgi:hypothetical protein